MLKFGAFSASVLIALSTPIAVCAQSALDSTAASANNSYSAGSSNTQYQHEQPWQDTKAEGPGQSMSTGTQGWQKLNLPETVSGMPYPNSDLAPGNLALMQQKLKRLLPTVLSPLSNSSDEAVLGDEGAYINGFGPENRLEQIMPKGLTTGHPSDAPPAGG